MGIKDIGFDEEITPPLKDSCDIYYDSFYIYEDMIEIMKDILSKANHGDPAQTKVCKEEYVMQHLLEVGVNVPMQVSSHNIADILIQCKHDECEAILIDTSFPYQTEIESNVVDYKDHLRHNKRHSMYTKYLHQTEEVAECIPFLVSFVIAIIFQGVCVLRIDVVKRLVGFSESNLEIKYDVSFTEIIDEGIKNNNRYVKMMRQLHRQTYEKTIVVGDGMNTKRKHAVESAVSKIFQSNQRRNQK